MTDGGIVMDHQGREIKRFDVRDGHGIRLLMRAGLQVGLVTGRSSRVVAHRAKDLGIRMVYQNAFDKLVVYQKIKKKTGLRDREIAYFGDDVVDLPVLRRVGLAIAVRDAEENVRKCAHYVTKQGGGNGAVREVVDLLLRVQGRWEAVVKKYFE
ncbi:MAG: HAD hydrolase family protein [Deltaproteobacteria bacterium]|nr:HAD hydrolase family protein [Deltaproteobacteria bacterium]